MTGLPQIVVALVALQRLLELIYAGRNTRLLRQAGGREVGAGHYPLLVALHGIWLAAIFLLTPPDAQIVWPLLVVFVGLQVARIWVIATLGRYWTTRIITIPGAPLIGHGPYRLLRHPNYLIVGLEIPLLPLAFGQWLVALIFGIFNLALLRHRIRIENTALDPRRAS